METQASREGGMSGKICKTCKWAQWQPMKNGRPNPRLSGRCTWPAPEMPLIPICVEPNIQQRIKIRNAIWRDSKQECGTWEAA